MTDKTTQAAGCLSRLTAELGTLLPLAAKAVGYDINNRMNDDRKKISHAIFALCVKKDGELVTTEWNPLESNADAFRLAIDLRMAVYCGGVNEASVVAYLEDGNRLQATRTYNDVKRDVAMRIAITECAIEIGRRVSV